MEYETGEKIESEKGGKQSALTTQCELLPSRAILLISQVLKTGAQAYGEDNWRLISSKSNLGHALKHIFEHLEVDNEQQITKENLNELRHVCDVDVRLKHLVHAGCRILFAIETFVNESSQNG